MKTSIALCLIALAHTATAQLAPELAPHAAKRTAALEALDKQGSAAFSAKVPPYLAALDAAEKTAFASQKLEAAANPELARQIKAETDAILATPGVASAADTAKKRGKIVNPDFTEADAAGFPVG